MLKPDNPDDLSLDQLLDLAYAHAKLVLLGQPSSRQIMPVFGLQSPHGFTVFGAPYKNDEEKERVRRMLRKEIRKRKVYRYSFVSEAWALNVAADEFHLRASKDPRRIEIVLALAVDRTARKIRSWKIERSEDGICRELTPLHDKNETWESWMAELLEEEA
jgi:hypothetical protein